jgi:putative DNA primase/helicase
MGTATAVRTMLGDYLDRVVYPSLFDRLPEAFPEFGFAKKGGAWQATHWPLGFPFPVEHEHPDRLMVYADRPWWIKIHGHSGVRFLDYVSGGRRPAGDDFETAVRTLCELSGVECPEFASSKENRQKALREEERRAILERLYTYCRTALWSERGAAARAYLNRERHLSDDHLRDLEIGLYPPADEIRQALCAAGHDNEVIRASGAVFAKAEGFVGIPWRDDYGHGLNYYGRFPSKDLPIQRDRPGWEKERRQAFARWGQLDPKEKARSPWIEPVIPKIISLPGADTKRSPLFLDRALTAGHRDVVAMEGVFDACIAQVFGDRRAIAYVAAQFSGEQIKTLQRRRIESVTICPDPDGGGDRGAVACVKALATVGITPFVCPRLPDGVDPDQFIIANGPDAWRAHVEARVHGLRHVALTILENQGSALR